MMNNKKILINYLLYFAWGILICIIGSSDVFAFNPSDFHVQTTLENKTTQYVSTTYLNSPVTNPLDSGYAFSDVFDVTYVIENYSFSANKLYQLESHLTNQKITNSNVYTVTDVQHNQSCLISYSDSIMNNDSYPRWAFQCPQATNSISISISNSSGSNLWSGSGIFNWVSSVLWVTDNYTLDGTTDSSDNIINNANQNADRIINNQNENTQEIINSIDGTFKNCHESVNLLPPLPSYSNSGLTFTTDENGVTTINGTSTGSVNNMNNDVAGIVLQPGTYTFSSNLTGTVESNSSQLILRDMNNENIAVINLWVSTSKTFTITESKTLKFYYFYSNPSKTYNNTISVQLQKGSVATSYEQYGEEICINKLDEQTDAINNLNDTINDDDIGDSASDAADFITDFETDTFGLTSIITAPLSLIQSLTSSTCTSLHLPLPYLDNKYLDLPCMSSIYSTYFGSFFTIYQTITYGIIAYWVCVRIFNQVKDFKNPEHDEIEVVDL